MPPTPVVERKHPIQPYLLSTVPPAPALVDLHPPLTPVVPVYVPPGRVTAASRETEVPGFVCPYRDGLVVDMEAVIRATWDDPAAWHGALVISSREGSGQPHVVNSSCHIGPFQIAGDPNGWSWTTFCGMTQIELMDAYNNSRCAWLIYEYQGRSFYPAWSQTAYGLW